MIFVGRGFSRDIESLENLGFSPRSGRATQFNFSG